MFICKYVTCNQINQYRKNSECGNISFTLGNGFIAMENRYANTKNQYFYNRKPWVNQT